MQLLNCDGVRIAGICSCVPARSEDNLARCTGLYGDAERARSVVRATGIRSRRVVPPGTSSLDLCVKAAESLLASARVQPRQIGAVVDVTFTPERQMPCNACQAQRRLGLATDVLAFDVNLACSGWPYGLFVAGGLARTTGRMALLLDGDAQTPRADPADPATVPVLADAGTATLVAPGADGESWVFSFLTDGAKGDALTLPVGGTIAMDGFSVFRFVTTDVLAFVRDFLSATDTPPESVDAFVPHQANVYVIRQVAKKLGLAERLRTSAEDLGNSASASVPTTIARTNARGRVLAAGFGGGLSASAALVGVGEDCVLGMTEI